jgi:hypothetical protein
MISVHKPIWALVGLGAPKATVAMAAKIAAPEGRPTATAYHFQLTLHFVI